MGHLRIIGLYDNYHITDKYIKKVTENEKIYIKEILKLITI
jgi:hypothetical protein